MDVKLFLRNKSIFNENYIYNIDNESFELSNLIIEYAQEFKLIENNVLNIRIKQLEEENKKLHSMIKNAIGR